MIPRRRGFGRQIEHVRPIAAADRIAVAVVESEVENRRLQDHAVERDAMIEQIVGEHCRARRAVALAEDELRRIPATELREVIRDELTELPRRLDRRRRTSFVHARHDAAEA